MDGLTGINGTLGNGTFWDLPVAFALVDEARERIGAMTDEQRDLLREKSSQTSSDKELDELVRMVAEGKFE